MIIVSQLLINKHHRFSTKDVSEVMSKDIPRLYSLTFLIFKNKVYLIKMVLV